MVYKWGNIKRSVGEYLRNAFAENGIYINRRIELNVEIFNDILSQKTGHALSMVLMKNSNLLCKGLVLMK